jgi:hypothetical protein
MANRQELRDISKARLKTAKLLIAAEDWQGAGYMMGYALECALKAVICKTLRLNEYPESGKDDNWFLTHRLERLLRLSGMEDIFGNTGGKGFYAWGEFIKYYEGEWSCMRYDSSCLARFTDQSVPRLYNFLIGTKTGEEGIITVINRTRRW